jgi:hypothetical protein
MTRWGDSYEIEVPAGGRGLVGRRQRHTVEAGACGGDRCAVSAQQRARFDRHLRARPRRSEDDGVG